MTTSPTQPDPRPALDEQDAELHAVSERPVVAYVRPVPSLAERGLHLFDALWQYFGQDAMPRMAAALAYRTIFSLVPLLLVGFVMFRLFGDTKTLVEQMLNRLMEQTGLSAIAVNQENAGQWIQKIVNSFQGINFGAIGLVSAATLLYAAVSLLVDIESSFNHIYNASRARSWVKRVLQYWLMISLGPVLLYAGFVAGEKFRTIATNLALAGPDALAGPWAIWLIGWVVTVAISSILMFVLYTTVPNTAVRLRPALCGALVAGVLLEMGKTGFRVYIAAIVNPYAGETRPDFVGPPTGLMTGGTGYTALYGTLALIPLLMLWIYIMWFIVLFGLRVSFLLQHGRRGVLFAALRMESARRGVGTMWIDPARSVGVMVAIAGAFARGRTISLTQVARDTQLDEHAVQFLTERLEEAGMVHRIASEGREETFTLSRPAEAISVAEVVAIGQALAGGGRSGGGSGLGLPGGELLERIRAAQLQAVQSISLASLVPASRGGGGGSAGGAGRAAAPSVPPRPAVG
jgi:YihY family inner membrane protein